MNPARQSRPSPLKIPLITEKDRAGYERTTRELAKVLKRLGGYEPIVDDIFIDQIARCAAYSNRVEVFLDSDTATEYTYSRVIDTKLKLSKTIENAMHQLALNRLDRLGKQTEASLVNEFKEALIRGMKRAKQ